MREPGIAILSDQLPFREGLAQFLQPQGLQRVTEYDSAAEFLRALELGAPRLVMIDVDHRTDEPVAFLRTLRQRAPSTLGLIVSAAPRSTVAPFDAEGFPDVSLFDSQVLSTLVGLSSPPEAEAQPSPEARQQLWSALTPRQRDVLGHLSTGSDNLKIAAHLGISERAVKAHVSALLSVFSAENRTELAVLACRAGLRPPLRSRPKADIRAQPQPRSA